MILSYSIISSVILGFCYLAYRFFLAGECQHAINRGILLLTYAVSLTLPLVILAIILHSPNHTTAFGNIEFGELTSEIAAEGVKSKYLNAYIITDIIFKIYLIGLSITAAYFLYGLAMLWMLVKKGEKTDFGNFTLILVDDRYRIAPFGWKNCIAMRRSDYENDRDMILIHEYAHLKLLHWLDLLMSYLTICLQWYNPAAWAMREELRAIHEYQADETVIESGVDAKEYQLLLLKRAVGYGYQSLANSLNHSKLQKRVTMMYKKKTSLQRKLFALALIPAIGAGIAVTAIPAVAGALESLATISNAMPSKSTEKSPKSTKKDIFISVDKQPEYPGGMEALLQYLSRNIRYPEEAHKANEQGRVIVKFVVNKDGAVSDPEIVKGVSESLDNEALRVVSSLPNWTPGTIDGKPVDCYFTLPIQFKLQDDSPKEKENK